MNQITRENLIHAMYKAVEEVMQAGLTFDEAYEEAHNVLRESDIRIQLFTQEEPNHLKLYRITLFRRSGGPVFQRIASAYDEKQVESLIDQSRFEISIIQELNPFAISIIS